MRSCSTFWERCRRRDTARHKGLPAVRNLAGAAAGAAAAAVRQRGRKRRCGWRHASLVAERVNERRKGGIFRATSLILVLEWPRTSQREDDSQVDDFWPGIIAKNGRIASMDTGPPVSGIVSCIPSRAARTSPPVELPGAAAWQIATQTQKSPRFFRAMRQVRHLRVPRLAARRGSI